LVCFDKFTLLNYTHKSLSIISNSYANSNALSTSKQDNLATNQTHTHHHHLQVITTNN